MPRTSADNVTYNGDEVVSGYVIGTGAEIKIYTGFYPKNIKILNTEGLCTLEWIKNMDAGAGLKIVDSGSGTTDISFITTGGITIMGPGDYDSTKTPYAGVGFIIGTDSDINVSGEDLYFVAYR